MGSTKRFGSASIIAALLTVLVAVLTACGGSSTEASSGPSVAMSHALGTTEVGAKPKRVVALEFSFVEALLSLNSKPVGIADDKSAERIEQLAGEKIDYTSVGTRSEPNQEVIASLSPDLIIADTQRHSKIYDQLSKIAPTIVLNSREGSYEDMKANTVTIAKALGDEAAGRAVVTKHEQTMKELAAKVPSTENRTVQLVTARAELLRIHTSASFVGSVFGALGLRVPVESTKAYEDASLERIAAVNPAVLFIASDVDKPVTDTWKTNPLWTSMTAVSTGSVFEANRNLYTRFRGLHTAEEIGRDVLGKLYR